MFVGGLLLGRYSKEELGPRNVLLCLLSQDRAMHKGRLAEAFDVSVETLRLLRQCWAREGLESVWRRRAGGSKEKLTAQDKKRMEVLFAAGVGVTEVQQRVGASVGVSLRTVERLRTAWRARQEKTPEKAPAAPLLVPTQGDLGGENAAAGAPVEEAAPASKAAAPVQEAMALLADAAAPAAAQTPPSEELLAPEQAPAQTPALLPAGEAPCDEAAPVSSAAQVQHVGTWLLLCVVHALGLYGEAWRLAQRVFPTQVLRVALDAFVMAVALGQRCVEGVRRLATPSAPLLLRTPQVPSASWVRWRLSQFAQQQRGASWLMAMAGRYIRRAGAAAAEQQEPAVFYIDNHLRPYRGKHTVRKGWRMQDKRAVPGCSDYYVHDEEGRPLWRINVPEHSPLTDWLLPLARRLREALGPDQRLLLCFDRAGAHPEQMAALRTEGVEFVTYERKPYPTLPSSAFGPPLRLREETVRLCEAPRKNLRKGRGRVRRISVLFSNGKQINLLAVSTQPPLWLLQVMVGRWCQENSFKYAGERWGQDQLDGRRVEPYPGKALIPNPARRRIEAALRLSRAREGQALRMLASLGPSDPRRADLERELNEARAMQEQLLALRPSVPTHAPVDQTELRGELVRHTEEYKLALDTIRIACANAESELAAFLAPRLPRAAEAKKALSNLLVAPGQVQAASDHITVTLQPAATPAEQQAFVSFLADLDAWNLTLPADPRPLRFRIQT